MPRERDDVPASEQWEPGDGVSHDLSTGETTVGPLAELESLSEAFRFGGGYDGVDDDGYVSNQ
jgi:hypothetical protein